MFIMGNFLTHFLTELFSTYLSILITDMLLNAQEIESCRLKLKNAMTYSKWDLTGNKLRCDCQTYPFYQLVQHYNSVRKLNYLEIWQCDSPPRVHGLTFKNISSLDFMCDTEHAECPGVCECKTLAHNELLFVNCSTRNLTEIPKVLPSLTYWLDLQNNEISSLSGMKKYSDYPSLKFLDLSNNFIKYVDDEISHLFQKYEYIRLNNNSLRTLPPSHLGENLTLFLSGNHFGCDCHSGWLVKWLIDNQNQIQDFTSIQCYAAELSLNLLIKDRYSRKIHCVMHIGVKAAIGLALVVVILPLIVGLLYRYKEHIKVYIYIHFKWHPFNKSDDKNIRGMRFDAVVAYADEDVRMVLLELAPRLEGPDLGFRLCIRERNFYPGAPKTENASCAMENSRRMIVCVKGCTHRVKGALRL